MLLAVAALYITVPVLAVVSWVIDLWAKSYDFPTAQTLAKAALVAVVALAFAGTTILAGRACLAAGTPLETSIVAMLSSLPIAALLWLVHELDWRSVYLGAVMSPLATLIAFPAFRGPATPVAVSMVAAATALATWREIRSVKFRRYAQMLHKGCCCCGYKQRAVRELYAMGGTGRNTVLRFLNDPRSRYETRARAEWERCLQ